MLREYTRWLVPVTFTLLGFGSSSQSVTAQTTYPFNATYDVLSTSEPITQDVLATTISGTSTDAPYDLTTINGLTYSQVDFATGSFRFNTNPIAFGLQNEPFGSIVFGSGTNKLFGTDEATGVIDGAIDSKTLTGRASGTFTITGGSGIFQGATGTLAFSDVDTISLDPSVPTRARSTVNGSFQVPPVQAVPEPRTDTTLTVVGAIAAGVLLRCRRKLQSTSG